MAKPRPILPGASYLVSRRCSGRLYRLRPNPVTNAIVEYVLGRTAEKYGMLIVACVVMSTHLHLVVTDVRGVIPDFLRDFHRSVAKAVNASQGQWECLFAPVQTSLVELRTDEDIIDAIAYVATNPVREGAVEEPWMWPGVIHWDENSIETHRPNVYFSKDCPERGILRITRPDFATLDPVSAAVRIGTAIESERRRCAESIKASGWVFLDREVIMGASFVKRAIAWEARRKVSPRFAARYPEARLECVRRWHRFRVAYQAAHDAWRAGDRDVLFPLGTWQMRVQHNAKVHPMA